MTGPGGILNEKKGRRRRLVPVVAGASLPFLVAACGDGSPGAVGPVVHDSAGVTIVEYPPEAAPGATWQVDFEGAATLEGEFFQVAGAFRLDDGRVVVAERGERRLTRFDSDGARGDSFGGEGEGPGEFRTLSGAFRWPGDSILVFDIQLRRLTLFDDEGRLGRIFQLEVTDEVPFAGVQGVLADGSILATGFVQTPAAGPEDGRRRYSTPAHVFDPEGRLVAADLPDTDAESYFRTVDGGFTVFPTLFARRTRIRAGPEALVVARNDTWEIRYHSPEGHLRRIVRRTGMEVPVSARLRREAVDRTLEGDQSNRDPGELRRTLESMPVPEVLPAFDRVVIDRSGHVWVEAYDPAPGERSVWIVFDEEGRMDASVDLPRRFEPTEIGDDYLLGVLADELDVERVVLARLER